MKPEFKHHNILLGNGSYTINPEFHAMVESDPIFQVLIPCIDLVFPYEDRAEIKIVDMGALEGGFSCVLARAGYSVTGIEIRQTNYDICKYVKQLTNLPNLEFVLDDAWNTHEHGDFDVVWCGGFALSPGKSSVFFALYRISGESKGVFALHTSSML